MKESRGNIRSLDLSRRNGRFLVIRSEFGGFGCDTLKDVWFALLAKDVPNSVGRTHNIPFTKELRIDMARLEIPVSGWTCLRTIKRSQWNPKSGSCRCITHENAKSAFFFKQTRRDFFLDRTQTFVDI